MVRHEERVETPLLQFLDEADQVLLLANGRLFGCCNLLGEDQALFPLSVGHQIAIHDQGLAASPDLEDAVGHPAAILEARLRQFLNRA